MDNINYYINIVEKAIAKLGLDPELAKKSNGRWTISKGKIPVWIDVFPHAAEKTIYFQVSAPVMPLPQKNREQLALDLLEINHELFGVAFSIFRAHVYLRTIREAEGLDVNEARAMILRIANYADHYDDILQQKYPDWSNANFKNQSVNLN